MNIGWLNNNGPSCSGSAHLRECPREILTGVSRIMLTDFPARVKVESFTTRHEISRTIRLNFPFSHEHLPRQLGLRPRVLVGASVRVRCEPSLGEATPAGAVNSQATQHVAKRTTMTAFAEALSRDPSLCFAHSESGITKIMSILKHLCKDCLKKVKAIRAGERAVRKLKKNPRATWQQKQSWKGTIAKGMKAAPTPSEEAMADILEAIGYPNDPQKQIGPYIVDFFLPPALVLEVDGSVHNSRTEYDRARDLYMRRQGFQVLRIKNSDIRRDWEGVLDRITAVQPLSE